MPGVGVVTAKDVFSERVELTPRTSDPTSTEEGEGWIRSDIAPDSNQIATFRVDTGGSTIDVPILQTGTATDDVVEALRLSVGGTLGYVPAIPESKATFPAFRLQHNGQVYGWHDARGEAAFFDVSITSTNSPVDDGETLTVDYSVQNTGGPLNDTQDIRLDVGSSERDRDSGVTLASGTSTTGQLSWGSAAQGSYTASVLSDDDVASTSVSVESAIPPSEAIHQWGFDEDATDEIGTEDGTLFGNYSFPDGQWAGGQAFRIEGSADYMTTETKIGHIGKGYDFSIGVTFSADAVFTADQYLVGQSKSSSNRFGLVINSSRVEAALFDGSTYSAARSASVNSDTKYRVLYSRSSGGNGRMWLNNSETTGDTQTFSSTSSGDFTIGNRPDIQSGFTGEIDNVVIYGTTADDTLAQEDWDHLVWT